VGNWQNPLPDLARTDTALQALCASFVMTIRPRWKAISTISSGLRQMIFRSKVVT